MKKVHRVGIVEDDQATLRAVIRRVERLEDFSVVFSATDLQSASTELRASPPDLLLVDLALPDGDGTDLIRESAALYPELPVIVLSVFGDERRVIQAIEAGARGFLLKSHTGLSLADSLRELVAGGSPISPAIAKHLINRFRVAVVQEATDDSLSEREQEVLRLAAQGYTYQEIAELLGVTSNTVGSYTKRIYAKLAVHSKSQAVFEGLRLGIVKSPDAEN